MLNPLRMYTVDTGLLNALTFRKSAKKGDQPDRQFDTWKQFMGKLTDCRWYIAQTVLK